jgi:DNA-binding NarL/FixJ family response regulator
MTIRIYIFGEDGFTNNTLVGSLSMLGFDVIGETDNDSVATKMISNHQPDVVVMHLDHERIKALELAQSVRKNFPDMGIVFISKSVDLRLLGVTKKSLPLGVSVVQISKHRDLDFLKFKIHESVAITKNQTVIKPYGGFTDAQIETIRLMAAGNANSEIAKMRYVSEKSVEQMLARIALMLDIPFDHKYNSRVRILNSYYELLNGRS